MSREFTMQRMVTFAETDMAGVMHFSNYYRWMEEVEHAFWRSLGMSVVHWCGPAAEHPHHDGSTAAPPSRAGSAGAPGSSARHGSAGASPSRSVGASPSHSSHALSWPRVRTSCDYKSPARFEDLVTLSLRVRRMGVKSLEYEVEFQRASEQLAVGQTICVCCEMRNGVFQSVEIPMFLREKLAMWVA